MTQRVRYLPLLLTFLSVLLGFEQTASAHPHVWVDYYADAVGGKGGITKIKFRWHFDDMFTSMIKENFHAQTIGPKEVQTLRDSAFSNLRNYHYYTYVKLDGEDFKPLEVSDFDAALKGHNLEYTFSIKLPHPAKTIEVTLYDEEFYVDIGPPLQPMSPDKPGIMATATMKPKDFLTSSAEDGAKAPVCGWKKGEPRVSSTWGKFAFFIIICDAQ